MEKKNTEYVVNVECSDKNTKRAYAETTMVTAIILPFTAVLHIPFGTMGLLVGALALLGAASFNCLIAWGLKRRWLDANVQAFNSALQDVFLSSVRVTREDVINGEFADGEGGKFVHTRCDDAGRKIKLTHIPGDYGVETLDALINKAGIKL